MADKRKISKAEAVGICLDRMFSGQTRKEIVLFLTETYAVSTSAIQKWVKAAAEIAKEKKEKAVAAKDNDIGRPLLYSTPELMQAKIDEYYEWVKGERNTVIGADGNLEQWTRPPEPVTITGLCLFLGFESRQSFYDYEKRTEFSYTIKKARLFVEHGYEKKLHGQHVAGPIFALKNMGWKDKVETGFTDGEGNDIPVGTSITYIKSGEADFLEIKESE